MKLKSLIVSCLLLGIAPFVNAANYDQQINNVYDLLNYQLANKGMNDKARTSQIENQMRIKLLEDYAKQSAMKAAMIATNKQINDLIVNGSRELDAIYNFNSLMINGRVIPPVISMATDLYNQKGSDQVRLSKRIYNIERQAAFSSTAPNWRSYLKVNYEADAFDTLGYIGGDLSPRNSDEMRVWEKATYKGWDMGVNQAGIALQQKMERLNRDYEGMIRFHLLALQGKITMPAVSAYNLYDKNNGTQWVIDEQLLRLETLPQFSRVGGDKILSNLENGIINNPATKNTNSAIPAYSKPANQNGPAPYADDVVDNPDSNNTVASPPANFNKNNANIAPLSTIEINKGLDYGNPPNQKNQSQNLAPSQANNFSNGPTGNPSNPNGYSVNMAGQAPSFLTYAANSEGLTNLSVPLDKTTIIQPPVTIGKQASQVKPVVEETLQKVVDSKDIAPLPSLSPLDYVANPLGEKVERTKYLTITTTTTSQPMPKSEINSSGQTEVVTPVAIETGITSNQK